jgi:hypothetical protein
VFKFLQLLGQTILQDQQDQPQDQQDQPQQDLTTGPTSTTRKRMTTTASLSTKAANNGTNISIFMSSIIAVLKNIAVMKCMF